MAIRDNANSILTFPGLTIGLWIVALIRSGCEYRLGHNAYGWLYLSYRDPAGNLIAVNEDFSHSGVRLVIYRACDVDYPGRINLAPRSLARSRRRFADFEAEQKAEQNAPEHDDCWSP